MRERVCQHVARTLLTLTRYSIICHHIPRQSTAKQQHKTNYQPCSILPMDAVHKYRIILLNCEDPQRRSNFGFAVLQDCCVPPKCEIGCCTHIRMEHRIVLALADRPEKVLV